MTTSSQPPSQPPASSEPAPRTAFLDAKSFARLAPGIKKELLRLARTSQLSAAESLRFVFAQTFGPDRPRQELIRFLLFAAPIARRIAIELANANERVGNSEVSFADLKLWLWWLDTMDPLCARMIDLHYFAGLSTKETAAALNYPQAAVVRDLRFAKAWLMAKVS